MATADLGISGMTCEMMCGGMIKSALVKVPGVEKTEIVFHEGDKVGHAEVTYDPRKWTTPNSLKPYKPWQTDSIKWSPLPL